MLNRIAQERHDGLDAQEVRGSCNAVRQAVPMLSLDEAPETAIAAHADRAEDALQHEPNEVMAAVREIRYVLVEFADGPVAR
jgi:hypothetical protein